MFALLPQGRSNGSNQRIFLDLSIAFDTIYPERLLQIFHDEIGIGEVCIKQVESFLRGWQSIALQQGGGRIQNNMTRILNPPLRAKENIDPPTFNVKSLA